MHPGFGLGIILLAIVLLSISWLRANAPGVLKWQQLLPVGLVVSAIGAASMLAPPLLWYLGGGLAAGWLLRKIGMRHQRAQATAQPGQTSSVRTDWLDASLDHDTGAIAATIVRGRFQGSALDELSLEALMNFYTDLAMEEADDSVRILESYLDQNHPDWRSHSPDESAGEQRPAKPDGNMTRAEARQILGVEPSASEAEIVQAHRRLIAKMHPDRGGSTYLATKINQAKELLLG